MSKSTLPLDPRQALFIKFYTDPKSDTFANQEQSAIRAGYSETYAHVISGAKPDWLTENIQNTVHMVQRAERNLKKYLEIELDTTDTSKGNIDLAKIQTDVSKFILKNLARGKYSEDKEVNAPNVNIKIVNYGNGEIKDVTVEPNIIDVE
jgi:hypothetical protein